MSSAVKDRSVRHVTGRVPVMSETSYDRATSGQIALVVGLLLLSGILLAVWLSNFLPEVVTLPAVFPAGAGGFEDGDPNETLDVESPEDPSDDPSLSNDQQETQLEQITEQIVTLSNNAATMVAPNEYTDASGGGNPGSAVGTGGRPYGSGGGGTGGAPNDNRWLVQFAEQGNLKVYARQLDFFGIELGLAFKDGRMFYLSNMSTTNTLRQEKVSSEDQRLFMSWQGGDRVKADRDLLRKANVPDVDDGIPLHFYPKETEAMLTRLELDYGGKQPNQIRRTYFQVEKAGNGYKFRVTQQKLK